MWALSFSHLLCPDSGETKTSGLSLKKDTASCTTNLHKTNHLSACCAQGLAEGLETLGRQRSKYRQVEGKTQASISQREDKYNALFRALGGGPLSGTGEGARGLLNSLGLGRSPSKARCSGPY